MIEICQFQPDEIDEAIKGMDGLQEILVPILRDAAALIQMQEMRINELRGHTDE